MVLCVYTLQYYLVHLIYFIIGNLEQYTCDINTYFIQCVDFITPMLAIVLNKSFSEGIFKESSKEKKSIQFRI